MVLQYNGAIVLILNWSITHFEEIPVDMTHPLEIQSERTNSQYLK